jgi:hypothetical protein
MATQVQIVFDCADPKRLAGFWATALHYFQRVPEEKTVKNRVHLDLNVGGGREAGLGENRRRVDAEVVRLEAEGATVIKPGGEERGEYWVVMQDPEGNEFCVQ